MYDPQVIEPDGHLDLSPAYCSLFYCSVVLRLKSQSISTCSRHIGYISRELRYKFREIGYKFRDLGYV